MSANNLYDALQAFFNGDAADLKQLLRDSPPSETLLRSIISEARQLVREKPLADDESIDFMPELSRLTERMAAVIPDGKDADLPFDRESHGDSAMNIAPRKTLGMAHDVYHNGSSASQILYEALLEQHWMAMGTWAKEEHILHDFKLATLIQQHAAANGLSDGYREIQFGMKTFHMMSPELQASMSRLVQTETLYPKQNGEYKITACGAGWKSLLTSLKKEIVTGGGSEELLINRRMQNTGHANYFAYFITAELASILIEKGFLRNRRQPHCAAIIGDSEMRKNLASLTDEIVDRLLSQPHPLAPEGEPLIRRTIGDMSRSRGSENPLAL